MELTQRYRQADLACARIQYRLRGMRMFERETLAPDAEGKRELKTQWDAARAQVEALEAPDAVFRLMKQHFMDFLDGEALRMRNYFSRPVSAVSELTWRIENLTGVDSRSSDERAEVLLAQLGAMDRLAAGVKECAANADADALDALSGECAYVQDNYRHYAEHVAEYFPRLSAKVSEQLSAAILSACASLEALKSPRHAAQAADDEAKRVPFTEEYYRSVLNDTLGVSLDALLKWHAEEMERTRAEVFEIAGRLPIAEHPRTMREVSQVLAKYAGPCDSWQEMFARTKEYLRRAQAAAHEYVWFPEEECRLQRVPYPLRDSFPWGGYSDGDGVKRPITGTAFLNDGNFKAISDGWLKMQAVHEAYPGHHVQYVRNVTDTLPETFKLGAKHIPLIEGTAHRSERLFEFLFPEDPFYPLFVAFRRHHTAVRIKSDLMLRYEGRPIADCVKLYMDELDFDHGTARGQVRAQESMEGYFTCYYYGMKTIGDYERQSGLDSKQFTEMLFSSGNVSMENLKGFLQLDDAQRASYRSDFCSLLMDPQDVIRYRR